ncbi:MAG: hypothetical protein GKR88_11465 [Flavobacteriaceae bacterium]|nr:MAG: hypothetical protein GKR88_11465 [Flavobacteriaceae bacterium]
MTKKEIRVIWSRKARTELKHIFERVKEKTKSLQLATNTKTDILNASKEIVFIDQYQVEEFLGEPYRRIVVRHYKLIYKAQSESEIRILKVFDTFKHPDKVKDI